MCPMRVFLVLFSALLAAYLAWRNYSKDESLSLFSGSEDQSEDLTVGADEIDSKQQVSSKVSSVFWTLVDMASGRYLWKGIKSLERSAESNAS